MTSQSGFFLPYVLFITAIVLFIVTANVNIYRQDVLLTHQHINQLKIETHQIKKGVSPKNAPTYIPKEEKLEKETIKERKEPEKMIKYKCTVCGYIYDPKKGDPESGVNPGTPFEDLPDDWVCPVCGAGKDDFEEVS